MFFFLKFQRPFDAFFNFSFDHSKTSLGLIFDEFSSDCMEFFYEFEFEDIEKVAI